MEVVPKPALRFAENLTMPTVQVIVMSANMGCNHCRQRVSRVICKMNGLLDYVVDVPNREVTVRGVVDAKRRKTSPDFPSRPKRDKPTFSFGVFSSKCFTA